MIRQLPGGGLASGISSVMPERDEETAALMWDQHMDGIRRQAAMRVRPVRAALDADEHRSAAAARMFLDVADEHRGAAVARMFLEVVEAARNGPAPGTLPPGAGPA